MRLRATREFRYNTRRLLAGDEFTASRRDGKVLVAIRKATAIRETADVPPPPPAVAEQIGQAFGPLPSDELKALRQEYETRLGKRPFPGWSAEQLREKIAAANQGG